MSAADVTCHFYTVPTFGFDYAKNETLRALTVCNIRLFNVARPKQTWNRITCFKKVKPCFCATDFRQSSFAGSFAALSPRMLTRGPRSRVAKRLLRRPISHKQSGINAHAGEGNPSKQQSFMGSIAKSAFRRRMKYPMLNQSSPF